MAPLWKQLGKDTTVHLIEIKFNIKGQFTTPQHQEFCSTRHHDMEALILNSDLPM